MFDNQCSTRTYMSYLNLFLFLFINFIKRNQCLTINNPFSIDPFAEVNSADKVTTSTTICISNGALAGAIIGTIILCVFTGFLIWLVYLRPKFQELNEHLAAAATAASGRKKTSIERESDKTKTKLPLDVTDYKFGTFPFRQSQILSVHKQSNRLASSSFRSVNMDQDSEMLDIELLEPTFGGLNFSITGNMRAGIFIKEIVRRTPAQRSNTANLLKTGDRILALTISFQSIVYEDALTILSYASPYPVILRIQRPLNPIKISEKRNNVKWRDNLEKYENHTMKTNSKVSTNNKTNSTKKGNNNNYKSPKNLPSIRKKSRNKTVNQTSTMKSVTNAVISYLHYKGSTTTNGIERSTEPTSRQDQTTTPYYDSPYDYYYGGQTSQYQYLHQSQLNKNNNNSLSADTLTTVTPNLATSVYTLELTSKKLSSLPPKIRRCERRLSSPAIVCTAMMDKIDTFV